MSDPSTLTIHLRHCLDRLRAGDDSARDDLLARPLARLRRLARACLRLSPRVHRWEETDDVVQGASLRLWAALAAARPASPAEFYRLAAACVRRELVDLARKLYGPEGVGARHAGRVGGSGDSGAGHPEPADPADGPARMAVWTEFHETVDALPPADRELFDLLWYQGLSQPEAAVVLGVDERTVRRRWRAARVLVAGVLADVGAADL